MTRPGERRTAHTTLGQPGRACRHAVRQWAAQPHQWPDQHSQGRARRLLRRSLRQV